MPAHLVLAHAGHWLEVALFGPAMLVVIAAIGRSVLAGRRPDRCAGGDGASRSDPAAKEEP